MKAQNLNAAPTAVQEKFEVEFRNKKKSKFDPHFKFDFRRTLLPLGKQLRTTCSNWELSKNI
jgi:hypothetical protein